MDTTTQEHKFQPIEGVRRNMASAKSVLTSFFNSLRQSDAYMRQ